MSTANMLFTAIREHADAGQNVVVLLTNTSFIDSDIVYTLFSGDIEMLNHGRRLVILDDVEAIVERILELYGVHKQLLCADTLPEAIELASQRYREDGYSLADALQARTRFAAPEIARALLRALRAGRLPLVERRDAPSTCVSRHERGDGSSRGSPANPYVQSRHGNECSSTHLLPPPPPPIPGSPQTRCGCCRRRGRRSRRPRAPTAPGAEQLRRGESRRPGGGAAGLRRDATRVLPRKLTLLASSIPDWLIGADEYDVRGGAVHVRLGAHPRTSASGTLLR